MQSSCPSGVKIDAGRGDTPTVASPGSAWTCRKRHPSAHLHHPAWRGQPGRGAGVVALPRQSSGPVWEESTDPQGARASLTRSLPQQGFRCCSNDPEASGLERTPQRGAASYQSIFALLGEGRSGRPSQKPMEHRVCGAPLGRPRGLCTHISMCAKREGLRAPVLACDLQEFEVCERHTSRACRPLLTARVGCSVRRARVRRMRAPRARRAGPKQALKPLRRAALARRRSRAVLASTPRLVAAGGQHKKACVQDFASQASPDGTTTACDVI